jgi:hypothetical protein
MGMGGGQNDEIIDDDLGGFDNIQTGQDDKLGLDSDGYPVPDMSKPIPSLFP